MYADSFLGKVVLVLSMGSFKKSKIEQFTPTVFLKEGDLFYEKMCEMWKRNWG